MIIYKEFSFDSAHYLSQVPEGHKCGRLHGHTYHLKVFLEGTIQSPSGWVVDFNDLKAVVKPILEEVDHALLNDISGLENPTSELFAVWLWDKMKPLLPQLKRIELQETPSSGVIYEGF